MALRPGHLVRYNGSIASFAPHVGRFLPWITHAGPNGPLDAVHEDEKPAVRRSPGCSEISRKHGSMIARAALQGEPRRPRGGTVNYFPPFEVIRRAIDITTVRGELRIDMPYQNFVKLLRQIISGIEVDEAWYARLYEDIGQAIRLGTISSARHHFLNDGYFEGRLPFPIKVDEDWYLRQYPDVADGIRKGTLTSAQEHFEMDGYREGRLPFEM